MENRKEFLKDCINIHDYLQKKNYLKMKFSQFTDGLRNFDRVNVIFGIEKSLKKRKLTEEYSAQFSFHLLSHI